MKTKLKKTTRARSRALVLCLGLAAMLVLASAILAGAAEAKKQGVPSLKKGVTNLVETTTALAGFVADAPVLKLHNKSKSESATALELQVEPGKAPLTVNEEAGTATDLSADELDGRDSTEFLGVGGKAADSELLDGKDSTEFLGADEKAADSDKLDGKDSTEFLGADQKAADADKLDGLDANELFPVFTARNEGPVGFNDVIGFEFVTIVSKNVPPGNYVVNAKTHLTNRDQSGEPNLRCNLLANGNLLDGGERVHLGEELEVGESVSYVHQAVLTDFDGQGPIEVSCREAGFGNDTVAMNSVITAIKVGSVQ